MAVETTAYLSMLRRILRAAPATTWFWIASERDEYAVAERKGWANINIVMADVKLPEERLHSIVESANKCGQILLAVAGTGAGAAESVRQSQHFVQLLLGDGRECCATEPFTYAEAMKRPWGLLPVVSVLLLAGCASPVEPVASPSTTTPAATATDAAAVIPSDCASLYSQNWSKAYPTFTLTTDDPASLDDRFFSNRPGYLDVLQSNSKLMCAWSNQKNLGVITSVVPVTTIQRAEVLAAMQGDGWACQTNGTAETCTHTATTDGGGSTYVESYHYFREGVWVANFLVDEPSDWQSITNDVIGMLWP